MRSLIAAIAALFVGAPAMADETRTATNVHSYILLDRTGSMQDIWDEALGSVNAFATSFGEADADDTAILKTHITLAAFDSQGGLQFDILRQNVSTEDWTNVTNDETSPRGMTPLFDAIGQIVSVAETDSPEKAVIVIMTDGKENASREMTKDNARAALDRAEARGWEVVFLGAEFATFDDADAVGVSSNKQMAVSKDQLGVTMERLAKKSRDYGQSVSQSTVEFDDEDRAIAEEEDVKQRKGN